MGRAFNWLAKLNDAEFNALHLDEVRQVTLAETNGCFVCFDEQLFNRLNRK